MAAIEKYSFFDYTDQDPREYEAAEFADYFGELVTNGVLPGETQLKVYGDGGGMRVKVRPGGARINGYRYALVKESADDGDFTVAIAAADDTLPRRDIIVLRLNTDATVRTIALTAITGTPAANPQPPAPVREGNIYDIQLARINVAAAASGISAGNVADTRDDAEVCGRCAVTVGIRLTGDVTQTDITVAANAWSSAGVARIAVSGLQKDDAIRLSMASGSTENQLSACEAALIGAVKQEDGYLTLHAYGTRPTIALPMTITRYSGEGDSENSGAGMMYIGKVVEQTGGDTHTFAACDKAGYYSFTGADLSTITDAPGEMTRAGILFVYPRGYQGTASTDDRMQVIIDQKGSYWYRKGDSAFTRIVNSEAASFQYQGAVINQASGDEHSFSDCIETGYYSFTGASLAGISDAPEGLTQAGMVTTYYRAGGGTGTISDRYQFIRDNRGNEWFRTGTNAFAQTVDAGFADEAAGIRAQIGYTMLEDYTEARGNLSASGTWNNVNAHYMHRAIPISGGDEIILKAGALTINYGILASYETPAAGSAVNYATGYTGPAQIAANGTAQITAPDDAAMLILMTWYNDTAREVDATINRLKLSGDIAENLRAALNREDSAEGQILDGIEVIPVWENGSFASTSGANRNASASDRMRTRDIITADRALTLQTDGEFEIMTVFFDASDQILRAYGYETREMAIPKGSRFRVAVRNAAETSADLRGYDPEELRTHVRIIKAQISRIAHPGVKWIAMGDSITEGYVSSGDTSAIWSQVCWATLMAHYKNWELNNIALGGTGWIKNQNSDRSNSTNAWYIAGITDFSEYNIVTLAYGINDYKAGIAIGSMADAIPAAPTTIIGGMRKTIESILASNPTIKIIVILPMNSMGYSGERTGDYASNYAIGTAIGTEGGTLEEVHDAMTEVCRYYGIEYIDQTFESIVNRQNIAVMLPDGVHPSRDAHAMIARELGGKIRFI